MNISAQTLLTHPELVFPLKPNVEAFQRGLDLYYNEWCQWNPKIRLTAESDWETVVTRHVFDSLQYARAILPSARVLDLGSGGGFPGVFLKMALPDLDMTLLEANRKRVSFLKSVVNTLSLPKLTVVHSRAEGYAPQPLFDQITLKAVSTLEQCLLWSAPLCKTGGEVIIRKEPSAQVEVGGPKKLAIQLQREIPIKSYDGIESKLMVFQTPGLGCDL